MHVDVHVREPNFIKHSVPVSIVAVYTIKGEPHCMQ